MKKLSLLLFLLGVILVCGVGVYAAAQYQEAPELAALVEAGQLPPVEERLPAEPLVVKPVDSMVIRRHLASCFYRNQ